MSLPRTFDEIEYHLPARYVIRFRDLSRRIRVMAIHWRYWRDRLARQVLWIVAIAGVLAYLVVAAWIENRDLTYGEQVRDRAIAQLTTENAELRGQAAEQARHAHAKADLHDRSRISARGEGEALAHRDAGRRRALRNG